MKCIKCKERSDIKFQNPFVIVICGASGDLARKKVIPAVFSLYCQGCLPDDFIIAGFGRSDLNDKSFRELIVQNLTCRYTPEHSCSERMQEFLARCYYVQGFYNSPDSFLDLYMRLKELTASSVQNIIFYLAVTPDVYVDISRSLAAAGLNTCSPADREPWMRIVVEKPFGYDRASSDKLAEALSLVFSEDQIFRIDHYLGKEVVQDLMVLRFANTVLEPIWNRHYVSSVDIIWKEKAGIEARGSYFDNYGIIRDVIQNHLLQLVALIGMEEPASIAASDVNRAKIALLKAIAPVQIEDVILGQYTASEANGVKRLGYRDEANVRPNSKTPTFASCVLNIGNDRWDGIPFRILAGKALDENIAKITICFRVNPGNIFCGVGQCPATNNLTIIIQPDPSINLYITHKEPGQAIKLVESPLDLQYVAGFNKQIPEAYERLILDVIGNNRTFFISTAELAASWDVLTPLLKEIEAKDIQPCGYPFGASVVE